MSMTGFGRARGALSSRMGASVVVSSVNHRYLDLHIRSSLREEIPEAEAAVREVVAGALQRGRVTVQLRFELASVQGVRVLVDRDAVASTLNELRSLESVDSNLSPVQVRDVLNLPGLVSVSTAETLLDEDEVKALAGLTQAALEQLVSMRVGEAAQLRAQIEAELQQLGDFLDWFEPQMEGVRERVFDRLRERVAELLGPETNADPDRLAQEAAVLADRSDVAEEVVRLRSHLGTFAKRLRKGGTVGRSLDFLCQEINRELNTLASKCREPGVAERLVDAKTATERIREQVQNLQ